MMCGSDKLQIQGGDGPTLCEKRPDGTEDCISIPPPPGMIPFTHDRGNYCKTAT